MEETPQGRALAAATREAIKAKKRALEHVRESPLAKRPARQAAPCHHEFAVPQGYSQPTLDAAIYGTIQEPIWDGATAKSYPFQLDSFQTTAVACIERNESVLVAAHTSAGKTAVAEYAIAKALKADQRVVYTSPLKALSNQKFRELSEEFGDVGLMTGDVCLNPNAACIVMTTEILRSMIYRGSELLREVAWVIFDEVHYMQDRERGVVWEEVIIFMPKAARMVFLSATLPNSLEFAEWVASVHGAPCHVVSTDYRPTPLVHYGFPLGGNGLYLLVDDQGRFRDGNFEKMKATFPEPSDEGETEKKNGKSTPQGKGDKRARDDGKGRKQQGPAVDAELEKLVRLLKDKHWDPIIVFSFSRRECEDYASRLGSIKKSRKGDGGSTPIDFNSPEEKEAVAAVFESALQCLSEEDRSLPFIQTMLPMLQRGIGVHHSGLLPIIKELVEILFQEQLIKCLFSTETFAMGLNMPAKTVIFTSLRKWDGEETRFVNSGEYIQMSGRAGRRGKDDRGYAIMLADGSLDEPTCRAMVKGAAAPLLSSFKLTYYTLVNLLQRVEGTGADMEYVISRSFSQFQHERRLPELQAQIAKLREEAESIASTTDEAASHYIELREEAGAAHAAVMQEVLQPDRCIHFLRAGRIVRVADGGVDYGYGVVVSVMRMEGSDPPPSAADKYVVDVLLCCERGAAGQVKPSPLDSQEGELLVVPVGLPLLSALGTLRISIPSDLKDPASRRAVHFTLRELVARYPDGVLPELDPIQDMGITKQSVVEAAAAEHAAKVKIASLSGSPAGGVQGGSEAGLRRKAQLLMEADTIERQMRESQLTSFREEAKNRLAVLQKLGHITEEGIVTLKGRAAGEIDTGDELLASEMMFNGTFGSLDKHQLAALVSCLVPVENSNAEIKLTAGLADGLAQLQETARFIASTSLECKLSIDSDTYLESFKPTLMDPIHAWSKGAPFGAICQITDIYEGSLIRAIRRLDELMHNLQHAAAVVGETSLAALFEASRETLRRDLPFAASLYI